MNCGKGLRRTDGAPHLRAPSPPLTRWANSYRAYGAFAWAIDNARSMATQKRELAGRMTIAAAICLVALFLVAPHAGAQGCAMCYQNAAASGAKGQAALRHGILILLIPALGIFGSILGITLRRL